MKTTLYDKPIQHGELVLKPISPEMFPDEGAVQKDSFIGAYSNQGHHHVLQAKGMIVAELKDKSYVNVTEEGIITHLKTTDNHPDLRLPVGFYQLNIKTEYDIYEDVIRDVQD